MAATRSEAVLAALHIEVRERRGDRAWVRCPFHEDQEERECFVRVSGERALTFWCFACKTGGGLWRIVEKVKHLSEAEARLFVRESGRNVQPPKRHVKIVTTDASVYRRRFVLPSGVITTEPLTEWQTLPRREAEHRGLDQQAIDEYGIGYAIDGRLSCRIVFPVLDTNRRPVSYSARTFTNEEPRYKTPADDEAPDKDAIFGAHLWPSTARETVILTEGAIDAFSARRATGLPSGSLSGSDVRARHMIELATFKTILVMTDADQAGDHAAKQILLSGLPRHARVKRLRLIGTDANDLFLRDPTELRAKILHALT